MKKLLLAFSFVALLGQATQIDLQNGDEVQINPNRFTTVTCSATGGGGGNTVSCIEECQRWYNLDEVVNNQWQTVAHCAFQITCESTESGCIRRTECQQFQTINTVVHNRWQNVVSCAGTRSTLTCN